MKKMNLTKHASMRLKKRGIPLEIAEQVVLYGEEKYTHGSVKYHIPKSELRYLENEIPNFKKHKNLLKNVLVVSKDSTIITVMKRSKNKKIFN